MLKVVLDTNAILKCISRRSPFAFVLDKLYNEKFTLCISTEILFEYEEKITEIFDYDTSESTIGILPLLENVKQVDVRYYLQVINVDLDDNKFIDCAFAANAHYLVTNDKHFNILKSLKFPTINVITFEEFAEMMKKQDL